MHCQRLNKQQLLTALFALLISNAQLPTFASDIDEIRARQRERLEESLHKSLDSISTAEENKTSNPSNYLRALIQVASCYKGVGQDEKAAQTFNQASDFYLKTLPLLNAREFWIYLGNSVPEDQFNVRFPQLLEYAERNSSDTNEIDDFINDVLRFKPELRGKVSQQKQYLQKAINIRSVVRGPSSPTLAPILRSCARACEAANETGEAEKYYLQAITIGGEKTSRQASEQVHLAEFYLRHDQFEKADLAWHKALALNPGPLEAGKNRTYVDLLNQYRKKSRPADVENFLLAILKKGGNGAVNGIDDSLEEVVDSYILAFNFARAESILKARLVASSTCTEDPEADRFRLKLSNLYAATNRPVESEKLYKDVLAAAAVGGLNTDNLRRDRAELLARLGRQKESAAIKRELPPQAKGPIKIEYGLLAGNEIRLGHNTSIETYDSQVKAMVSRGSVALDRSNNPAVAVNIAAFGRISAEGNLTFNGRAFGSVVSSSRLRSAGTVSGLRNFPPALEPPASGIADMDIEDGTLNRMQFDGGDFTSRGKPRISLITPRKPTRIFLIDSGKGAYACQFERLAHSTRNLKPIDYQIWYNGSRKIRIAGTAFVYVPNATVEIPFNGEFHGAIVANRIILEGNNWIALDKSLIGMTFGK